MGPEGEGQRQFYDFSDSDTLLRPAIFQYKASAAGTTSGNVVPNYLVDPLYSLGGPGWMLGEPAEISEVIYCTILDMSVGQFKTFRSYWLGILYKITVENKDHLKEFIPMLHEVSLWALVVWGKITWSQALSKELLLEEAIKKCVALSSEISLITGCYGCQWPDYFTNFMENGQFSKNATWKKMYSL